MTDFKLPLKPKYYRATLRNSLTQDELQLYYEK